LKGFQSLEARNLKIKCYEGQGWMFFAYYEFKGATIATRTESKWGGAMIKLAGLSTCLLHSALYFNSVVCRLLSFSY